MKSGYLRKKAKYIGSIILLSLGTIGITYGQTNYVLKTGDTMTGTLAIEAPSDYSPSIELFGSSAVGKYIQFSDTTDGMVGVLSFNGSAGDNALEWWYSPNGSIWSNSFSIGKNGILYGNAFGLTNLNVSSAIPNGSIAADKLDTTYLTSEVFTNTSIQSLSVGGWGFIPNNIGDNSMSVGVNNTASNSSFSSGYSSVATGSGSFAVGSNAEALGGYSQAQGSSVKAVGDYSYASGWNVSAVGILAHAIGWNNVASGQYSYVEGAYNISEESAWGAHVEGIYSKAKGKFSHAAGFRAITEHDNSFVWSSSDHATTNMMEFSSTTNRQFSVYADNGIRFVTGPNGTVEVQGQIIGDGSGITNINIGTAIPDGSISAAKVGTDIVTVASLSDGSISGVVSVAGDVIAESGTFGWRTEDTNGIASLVIGYGNANDFSFANGLYVSANGLSSFASGDNNTADGDHSFAQGFMVEASGFAAHAEGRQTEAIGQSSHAEGYKTVASNFNSHAEGHTTIAGGNVAHAQGYLSKALGSISHAAGTAAVAEHDQTFVWSSSDSNETAFASTTNHQFSVYADNGIRLVSGSSSKVDVDGSMHVTGTISGNFDLSNIGIYGDISMGSFTNTTASN